MTEIDNQFLKTNKDLNDSFNEMDVKLQKQDLEIG